MAGRADLGEHLQAALQLMGVKGAERAFEAEGDISGCPFAFGPGGAGKQAECRDSADCDFAKHRGQFLSLTRPDRRSAT